jgi:hypothetical protein
MTNPLHSEHCKCECDQLARHLTEIVALMKSNIGSPALWIMSLEDLLAGDDYV